MTEDEEFQALEQRLNYKHKEQAMNKQQEALKLALEALERVNANPSLEDWHHAFDEEVVAIREALAEQPAQQQEPWVELTEFDIDQIPYSCSHADSRLIAYAIEAKLREKNERGLT